MSEQDKIESLLWFMLGGNLLLCLPVISMIIMINKHIKNEDDQ